MTTPLPPSLLWWLLAITSIVVAACSSASSPSGSCAIDASDAAPRSIAHSDRSC